MEAQNKLTHAASSKRDPILPNLAFNLIVPILFLSNGTKWFGIEPKINILVALLFPVAYGLYDGIHNRKFNLFSALGILSVLAKGSIGFFMLQKEWVAINEAVLPAIFGIAVLVTARSSKPMIKTLLFNDQIFDTEKIYSLLNTDALNFQFEALLRKCTGWLAGSFLLSSVLNYFVAKIFIHTNPSDNLEQFNRELGRMQGWSYVLIMIPSTIVTFIALKVLLNGLHKLTGQEWEHLLKTPPPKPKQ
jgi:intracellular septation protein A